MTRFTLVRMLIPRLRDTSIIYQDPFFPGQHLHALGAREDPHVRRDAHPGLQGDDVPRDEVARRHHELLALLLLVPVRLHGRRRLQARE